MHPDTVAATAATGGAVVAAGVGAMAWKIAAGVEQNLAAAEGGGAVSTGGGEEPPAVGCWAGSWAASSAGRACRALSISSRTIIERPPPRPMTPPSSRGFSIGFRVARRARRWIARRAAGKPDRHGDRGLQSREYCLAVTFAALGRALRVLSRAVAQRIGRGAGRSKLASFASTSRLGLRAILDQLEGSSFSVPRNGGRADGRMDTDASPQRGGIWSNVRSNADDLDRLV